MNKPFRIWLENLWRDNCDERMSWGQPRFSLQEYFNQYKWWLRREYRYQKSLKK